MVQTRGASHVLDGAVYVDAAQMLLLLDQLVVVWNNVIGLVDFYVLPSGCRHMAVDVTVTETGSCYTLKTDFQTFESLNVLQNSAE